MMTTDSLARATLAPFSKRTMRTLALAATLLPVAVLNAADTLALTTAAARASSAPPEARTRLADFAHANAQSTDAALAQLALGLVEYEHGDYPGAVRDLDGLAPRLPKIADYAAFYLASAQAQLNDQNAAAATLAQPVWDHPVSPLRARALLLRAEALTKSQHPGTAAELLQSSYKDLPQPDGALALASAYDARGENVQAAAYYQRVYYSYPATPAAATASTALERLKPILGKNFPKPSAEQLIERPSKWIEAHQYAKA